MTYDVAVVGNGVLGQSLALALARRKVKVALVGAHGQPGAASAAAGAMLGCFGEVTSTLLASTHGRAKMELGLKATGMWPGWLARLSEEVGLDDQQLRTANGTVVVLNAAGVPEIDTANFEAIRAAAIEYGEKVEDVDPAELTYLDPDPAARPFRALFLPGEHAIDAAGLLSSLPAAFVRCGGIVVSEQAESVARNDTGGHNVRLASGATVKASQVVLASGARTQRLLDTVADASPGIPKVIAGFGVSALLGTPGIAGPDTVIRTPNRAFACGLHVVPRRAGELYVGATNIVSPVPVDAPVVRDLVFLLECASRQVHRDLWASPLHAAQIGNRPVTLDGFPLLGQTNVDGLWLMTGTYRDGLHLSPLLAEEMSRAVLGEEQLHDLSMFNPLRAPVQPAHRSVVVEQAVTHMLATGYEYGWQLPVDWPRTIERGLRVDYQRFAEEIHPRFTPPPELLAAARHYPVLVRMLRDFYAHHEG